MYCVYFFGFVVVFVKATTNLPSAAGLGDLQVFRAVAFTEVNESTGFKSFFYLLFCL